MKRPALLTSGWWDFHRAARRRSRDDRSFATVDADGIALAAIQGLNQTLTEELEQKETEITKLKQRLDALEKTFTINNQTKGTPP